jgi:hypothetical protein
MNAIPRLPFIEKQHEVPQVAAETIETPTDNTLDAMTTHVGYKLVERRSSILRAGDALVDVLDGGPGARRHVTPQIEQLVLGSLIVRAHARIDGDLHARPRRIAVWGACLFVFDAFFRVTPLSSSHARNARSS